MQDSQQTPKNFNELFELIFKKVYISISRMGKFTKFILGFLGVIVLFFLARVGVFGPGFQNVTYNILPFNIITTDKIDSIPLNRKTINIRNPDTISETSNHDTFPKGDIKVQTSSREKINDSIGLTPERIAINFNFHVNNMQGIIGKTYYSGDNVSLIFSTNVDCYMTVFCIDKKNIIGLFNKKLEPQKILGGDNNETISFELDDTDGEEVYYAIASHNSFKFEKDIKPKLEKEISGLGSKGPDLVKNIELDENKFFQKSIYFKHKTR
jgi:hypothetical protein